MLETARGHRAAGRDRLALQALAAVLQARPHLAPVQLDLARLRLQLGEPELVERQLGAFLALQGRELAAAPREELEAVLLEALLALERWEEAEALLQRRLGRGPGRPGDHEALARAAEARGDLAAAEAQLEQALQLDPHRAASHRELGQLRRRRGRWPAALEAYGRALSLAPLDAALEQEVAEVRRETLWARGEDALAQEQWAEARAAYGALLELEPNQPLAAQRLVLLQQLDPQRLQLAADWQAVPPSPGREATRQRLERFSRLLDRLEGVPATPPPG